ncbi:MAG: hypothetical protein EPO68_01360 [Planctomycetota bacterium]|nr:MAG: hypothetical protein EPO68_01360 [Planctomycetota bacterium]
MTNRPSSSVLGLSLLAAISAGCSLHVGCAGGSSWNVNGVRLTEQHTEVLAAPSLGADGIAIDIPAGQVRFESTTGAPSIEVVVHEKTKGDASVRYERGALVVTTKSGEPAALGDVLVRTNGPLAKASIDTGAGDVSLNGLQVQAGLRVDSGAGGVLFSDGSVQGDLSIESGAGDVELARVKCADLKLSSGAGDIRIAAVEARKAELDSGAGDLRLSNCTLVEIDADTGVGDVDVVDCTYQKSDFDTGVGDVRVRSDAAHKSNG